MRLATRRLELLFASHLSECGFDQLLHFSESSCCCWASVDLPLHPFMHCAILFTPFMVQADIEGAANGAALAILFINTAERSNPRSAGGLSLIHTKTVSYEGDRSGSNLSLNFDVQK